MKAKLIFIASLLTMTSLAASAEVVGGTCGDNLTWSYDTETTVLTIEGSGEMKDYGRVWIDGQRTGNPWGIYYNSISKVIANEVTSIANSAFYGCTSLSDVFFPKCTSVADNAFNGCTNLLSVSLPECVSIGMNAFENCINMETAFLPKVQKISTYAFYKCFSLLTIELSSIEPVTVYNTSFVSDTQCSFLVPDESLNAYKSASVWSEISSRIISKSKQTYWDVNVTCMPNTSGVEAAIGADNVSSIVSLKINGDINAYDIFVMRNNMPNLHILDLSNANIVATENGYKYYGSSTTEDNVIGGSFFYNQNKLLKVKLPQTITSIKSSAFRSCVYLSDIEIHEGVNIIEGRAFYGCGHLKMINLPKSLERIGEYAFYYCSDINSISIPSVQGIERNAFENCIRITSIILPSNLSSIGSNAFDGCSGLSEITLPSALKYIGGGVFSGCPINTVKATAIDPNSVSIADNAFTTNTYANGTLYIPYDEETGWETTYLAYKWHTQWGQFTNKATWKPNYDYINVGGDYEQETGTIPGEDIDADLGNESGYVIGEDAAQDLDDTHVKHDGTGGGSIINEGDEGNLNIKNLFIDIAVTGNKWYFFCFPFDIQLKDVVCDAQYVFRLYDGNERSNGKSGWKNLSQENSYLKAGKGYIFQCDKTTTLSLPVSSPKFSNSNKKTNLETFAADNSENASWNFIGNPYLSYFDMDNIDYSAPITRWNGSSYEAIRPGDDDYQFTPYEAFFVQKPQAATEVTFESAGQETKTKAKKKDAKAKARGVKRMSSNRHLINLVLSDGTNSDKTRVVFNNDAKMDYELDCDASKFMANGVAQIYSMDAKSVKYSINERPTDDGIVALGISVPEDGAFSIEAARMDTHVMLKDAETGTLFDLSDGAYTFTAKAGTYDNRFYLMTAKATGIEKAETDIEDSSKTVFDLSGRKVENNAKGLNIVNGKKVYVK